MNRKRAQAAVEVSVLIFLIGVFIIGYIILLPAEDRQELLDSTSSDIGEDSSDEDNVGKTLLSEAPGDVSSSKSGTSTTSLEPMRLYSTTESATETLATSLTVSRSILANNYKTLHFDMDNLDNLEDLGLLFLITESKGDLVVELNDNVVYEGEVDTNDLPLSLPMSSLKEEDNTLRLSTSSPGINIFSSHYYLLQDLELVEDFNVADTSSRRTFTVDEPGDVSSATLNYFITCNDDDEGILTISLNSREVFSDRIFCEYLNERELALDEDYLATSNTLEFTITEGDYNIEEVELEVKSSSKEYPSYTFDVDSDLYENVGAGDVEVYLKLTFADQDDQKAAKVLVNEHEFSFDTNDQEYERKITSMLDNGANTITLEPELSFEIDNIKVYTDSS